MTILYCPSLLAKEEIKKFPFFGKGAEMIGALFIKRGRGGDT